ncbi:MAG TPA: hypothetical protein PLB62_12955 [Candidatus Sumerlaeota bacterium]|nr:hypothetical protein [Candidatus Sumerlaeota bacterium]
MKNTMVHKIAALLFAAAVVSAALMVMGQTNPFAPASVMDEMSAAPVNTGTGNVALERARDIDGGPPPGMMEEEMMLRAPSRARRGEGEMEFYGPGPTNMQPTPPPTPTPKMIRVVTGSRVVCAVSGQLLEDTIYRDVPEADKDMFYDDGTHGDEVASDGTYTNITIRDDVMSPDSHKVLVKLLRLLENIEMAEPIDFFRLDVVALDPLTSLPHNINEEEERDLKLTEWNDRFLQGFRTNQNVPESPFFPLYVPSPPSYPSLPLPPGFEPALEATPTPASEGGRGLELEMEGNMFEQGGKGGRSSQYM